MVPIAWRLSVLALSGSVLAGCVSEPAPDFIGSWGSGESGQPELTLEPDGSVHGNDGCNSLAGSWEQQGETAVLGQLASTLMMCVEVDDWLGGADTLLVEGELLRVYDAEGTEIGSLPRR